MIVTEEQAAKLWCPQSRVVFFGETGNRVSKERVSAAHAEFERTGDSRDLDHYRSRIADCRCIGSACMFWRFVGYRPVAGGRNDEAHGTCGIAAEFPSDPYEYVNKSLWVFDPATGEKIKK